MSLLDATTAALTRRAAEHRKLARTSGHPAVKGLHALEAEKMAREITRRRSEPTFTTSEAEHGETFCLTEMISANENDTTLHGWLRGARVGETYMDVISVTRVG